MCGSARDGRGLRPLGLCRQKVKTSRERVRQREVLGREKLRDLEVRRRPWTPREKQSAAGCTEQAEIRTVQGEEQELGSPHSPTHAELAGEDHPIPAAQCLQLLQEAPRSIQTAAHGAAWE